MVEWTEATFQTCYKRPYRRSTYGADNPATWEYLRDQLGNMGALGLNPGANVLVVGSGWGWLLEVAVDEFNHDRIWGTDISTWINANKTADGDLGEAQARPDIVPLLLEVDVTDPNARTLFRDAGAGQQGRFDWVVTDLVMESVDVADQQAFLDACEALLRPNGNVAHIVAVELTPPGEGDIHAKGRSVGMIFQSLEEWVALRPAHYWLAINSKPPWRVLGGG